MVFSSYQFIIFFLIVFFGYFLLNQTRFHLAGRAWLTASSLFFYAYWNIAYLPLLLGSVFFNFIVGRHLFPNQESKSLPFSRRFILVFGIFANLALLGYFKYTDFFIENVNVVFDIDYVLPQIILPLGISFFTFTQIAYLVDSYRGRAKEHNLLNYSLFVTFFPYLIAGPIMRYGEVEAQFKSRQTAALNYENIAAGIFIFTIGLFKKVIIADNFAIWANAGFSEGRAVIDFFSAWGASLSYTFQIYYDFSGYCDMGMGAALLFNIRLPLNFNSPYKALNIREFWRRWHITLSRFLRDYLYIPLGGSRYSDARLYFNLIVTFLLCGLWHGASWMFVTWGALHGAALVVHRWWNKKGFRMPKVLAWLLTFNFINITWVFFRARTMDDALKILRGMVDFGSLHNFPVEFIPTTYLAWGGRFSDFLLKWLPAGLAANLLCFIAAGITFVLISRKNSYELMTGGNYGAAKLLGTLFLFCVAMYAMLATKSQLFLYFNF